jgi:hypothetical protein
MCKASKRTSILAMVTCLVLIPVIIILFRSSPGLALPAYAAATGQSCSACHIDPAGGGALNSSGQAFAAISTHSSDPAGAWAQAIGSPVPPMALPPAASSPTAIPDSVEDQINSKFNTVNRDLALWNIQPGLGTVMIEYGGRFANMWYAGQAINWDMVSYQVLEMLEIQETGETTRPARAPALKAFEESYLTPLTAAAKTKDSAAFASAYDKAIIGCNACHAGQNSADFPAGYKFVKIKYPSNPVLSNVDWAGQP